MAKKKKTTLEIDKKEALSIATQLLACIDGQPLEKTSTILNGLFIAMVSVAKGAKKYETAPGMVERMILSWFLASDNIGYTEFGKYINLKEE